MTMTSIALQYHQQPSLFPSIMRALLLPRTGFNKVKQLPNISAKYFNVQVDPAHLSRYLACCHLEGDGYLPIVYPHVLAARLHMNILTHRAFPIKLLGAVHKDNHIIAHRKIEVNERFDIETQITTHRIMAKGLEFDFTTTLTTQNEIVWESTSTFFIRGRFGTEVHLAPLSNITAAQDLTDTAQWLLKSNMGKRYARITCDYNPIHISTILAKLFGFKRDLLHGMCTLAMAVGQLPKLDTSGAIQLDVAFKGPMYLNNQATLKSKRQNNNHRFDLYCQGNDRPCICGLYGHVKEETVLH